MFKHLTCIVVHCCTYLIVHQFISILISQDICTSTQETFIIWWRHSDKPVVHPSPHWNTADVQRSGGEGIITIHTCSDVTLPTYRIYHKYMWRACSELISVNEKTFILVIKIEEQHCNVLLYGSLLLLFSHGCCCYRNVTKLFRTHFRSSQRFMTSSVIWWALPDWEIQTRRPTPAALRDSQPTGEV